MSELSPALIEEILTYLPVKSLMRFKCVQKSWYSLISSPQFAKLHLRRVKEENNDNHANKSLHLTPRFAKSLDFENAFRNNHRVTLELNYPDGFQSNPCFSNMRILGSCNGLICLSQSKNTIILWNPSTNVSKMLPIPDIFPSHYQSIESHLYYGLGYDDATGDYKLVMGSLGLGRREQTAEIFNLKSNKWRKIEDAVDVSVMSWSLGTYLNSSLHWVGWERNKIITFDIAEERFEAVLTLPNNYCYKTGSIVNLGVSQNRLCVFYERNRHYFEYWVLDGVDTNRTWTKVFKVPSLMRYLYFYRPLYFTNKGEILADHHRDVGLFSPHKPEPKFFGIDDEEQGIYDSCVYLETLVSPYCF